MNSICRMVGDKNIRLFGFPYKDLDPSTRFSMTGGAQLGYWGTRKAASWQ